MQWGKGIFKLLKCWFQEAWFFLSITWATSNGRQMRGALEFERRLINYLKWAMVLADMGAWEALYEEAQLERVSSIAASHQAFCGAKGPKNYRNDLHDERTDTQLTSWFCKSRKMYMRMKWIGIERKHWQMRRGCRMYCRNWGRFWWRYYFGISKPCSFWHPVSSCTWITTLV